jgi:hypothetical protein
MKIRSALLLLAMLALPAFAQEGWRDATKQPVPNAEFRKSVDGFGGWLLVTSDADWKAKWDTPSDTVPHFTEATHVARGKQVFVLIFFANPLLDQNQMGDVSCDIELVRPDGTTSMHQTDETCFKGTLRESPKHLFLAAPVIGFTGDPGDPAGAWVVHVSLKDNVRHAVVPLRTSFVLDQK